MGKQAIYMGKQDVGSGDIKYKDTVKVLNRDGPLTKVQSLRSGNTYSLCTYVLKFAKDKVESDDTIITSFGWEY